MDIAIKNTSLSESTLIWAIVCSILLHILFFVIVPNFKFNAIRKIPDELTIEIVQPKKPEPIVVPEPPQPIEQTKPEPKKSLPKTKPKTEPISAKENKPEVKQTETPPKPNVIAVPPKADTTPAIVVPTPEPPKEKPVNDEAYNSAKSSYRSSVQNEIQRNLRYPKMAEKRRITGAAKVEIHLDKEGNVTSVTVISSSGNDSLDAEAIAVIKRSDLKQYMNDMLAERINPLIMPISFTLPDE